MKPFKFYYYSWALMNGARQIKSVTIQANSTIHAIRLFVAERGTYIDGYIAVEAL